ncbi:MAG: T9SS C-terminal target domain-containing protein [Bacteroidetes bacterium]|nr:MAG: T9SS C-terminal target domain-containing protein [Bacteroidota bacterium]
MKKIYVFIIVCLFLGHVKAQIVWQNIGPGGGSDLHVVKFHQANPDIIYTGGDIEGVFKSTDGGQTWQNINNNLAQGNYTANVYWINDIVFDPQNANIVYLCTGEGLFKSVDGGANWQEIFVEYINEEPTMISTVAIDSANSNIIFMGIGDRADGAYADYLPFPGYEGKIGLFKSIDGGTTWDSLNVGMPDSTAIHSIIIHQSDTILISTTKGIYRSDDGGQTWQPKNNGLPHTNCHILKKTWLWGAPVLYLTVKTLGTPGDSTTFSGGVFRSDDLGDSWVDITGDLPKYDELDSMFYDYWKFDIDPLYGARLLISPARGSNWNDAAIYETWDADANNPVWDYIYMPDGQGWMDTAFFVDPYAHDIAFAPSNPAKVAYTNVYISLSNDSGYNYNQIYTTQVSNAWKGNGLELMNTDFIAFDPVNANRIYFGYDDMGLFRSDDDAQTFIRLDPVMDPVIGSIEGADGIKQIEIDPDNGDLYISRWQGSQGGYLEDYSAGGIAFSNDQGVTQTDITNGVFTGRCDIVLDKSSGSAGNRTLYAAVYYDGIYKTTNIGNSWTSVNNGLGNDAQWIWKITINPSNNQELYAATNHRGAGGNSLYKSTDGGQNWIAVANAPSGDVMDLVVTNSGNIYMAITDNFDWPTSGGVYKSSDNGDSWNKILDYPFPLDLDIHPGNEQVIAVAASMQYRVFSGYQQGVYLTEDGGNNWNNIGQGLKHTYINGVFFNPNNNTDLYVVTGGGGVWKTSSLNLTVNVKNVFSACQVELYPNPVSDKLMIKSSEKIYSVKVFDISGKLLFQQNTNGVMQTNLLISSLTKGVYVVELNGEENKSLGFYRIVKE